MVEMGFNDTTSEPVFVTLTFVPFVYQYIGLT